MSVFYCDWDVADDAVLAMDALLEYLKAQPGRKPKELRELMESLEQASRDGRR